MSEELFAEWFDREVDTGVRYSDNVIASLGPWSERREKFVRTIMEAAFYAGTNTRTPFEQAVREAAGAAYVEGGKAAREDQAELVREAVEAERAKAEMVIHGLRGLDFHQIERAIAAIRAPQETNE